MTSDPTLEEALDGLQTAERYCFQNDIEYAGHVIASVYQSVGSDAPEEQWDSHIDDLVTELDNHEMSDERIRELQETLRNLTEGDDR